jgi:pimeloyl-ACP methyl ester carboxylesterase
LNSQHRRSNRENHVRAVDGRGALGPTLRFQLFHVGKYPLDEFLPVALKHSFHAPDVDEVAAQADDHVAYELITSWSFSDAHQLGGNPLPGVWMTGSALRLMERTPPGVLHADLRACHEYTAGLSAAGTVRSPALLILGQRDQMAPSRNAQGLIAALRDKRVVTIPGCGHSLMTEAPDEVLDALRAFLAPTRASGAVAAAGAH